MRETRFGAAILAAVLSLIPLAASGQTQGPDDARLAEDVARRIHQDLLYSLFDDVSVAVEGGVATLSGRVTPAFKADVFARAAARVPGVLSMKNALKPLPVSMIDDGIRIAIADAMARDPVYARYTTYPSPPIHVIVENGRVTLTGVVASELERRKLELVVRGMVSVSDVQNRLQKN
jgi:hyperosmotically inducible protein